MGGKIKIERLSTEVKVKEIYDLFDKVEGYDSDTTVKLTIEITSEGETWLHIERI